MDNIFVERLWRSLKYEEVDLNAYASVAEAKAGIGSWLAFYNQERQHQSLGYRTPGLSHAWAIARLGYRTPGLSLAWAIARRVRPTKQNAGGYVDDRLGRPAAPSPTSPPAQPPTTD